MHPVRFLRIMGLVEGVSFLALVFVAMPLKYMAGQPVAVTVVGWIHGLLFMIFGIALARVFFGERWPVLRTALVLVAALLPFGPFLIDRRMRAYEDEASDPQSQRK